MTDDKRPILVFGATGRQGGSVAKALLKAGWPVRALVLDATGIVSLKLWHAGVELVQGSFEDRDVIRAAMTDAYGVFSVLPGTLTAEDEVRYGIAVADIAAETGIEHFIYSSGASAGDVLTGVPRFDAKPRIEAHVRKLSIKTTILRPMIFMEMLVRSGLGLDQGRVVSLIRPDQAMHLTAVEDIGKFAAAVFADKARFGGKTLKIASDRVTGRELEAAFTETAGRLITYERFPDDVLAANADLAHMAKSLEDGPLSERVDLDAMREINPEPLSLRSWLAGSGRAVLEEALGTTGCLRQQIRQNGRIPDAVAGHLNRPEFQRISINTDVNLAPLVTAAGPVLADLPLAFAREFDTGAVHQQMQRPRCRAIRDLHLKVLLPAAER